MQRVSPRCLPLGLSVGGSVAHWQAADFNFYEIVISSSRNRRERANGVGLFFIPIFSWPFFLRVFFTYESSTWELIHRIILVFFLHGPHCEKNRTRDGEMHS